MTPDLASYDVILVNTSGGKDSQAMLDLIVELAAAAGVRDRMVAVHADLGRVEWPGTRELAERQVRHYGVRFEVVRREKGDLLHQLEHERKMFPDNARRWCTSDQKTSQVTKLITRLVAERNTKGGHVREALTVDGYLWPRFSRRKVRILNCLGMRAQESPARAKKPPFSVDKISNGKRHVDRWLPLHTWTEDDVWARIRQSGVEHHPAYDQGMPRLSCTLCVLASKSALIRGAQLRPDLAAEYVRIEGVLEHRFRKDLSMAEIVAEAERTLEPATITNWNA